MDIGHASWLTMILSLNSIGWGNWGEPPKILDFLLAAPCGPTALQVKAHHEFGVGDGGGRFFWGGKKVKQSEIKVNKKINSWCYNSNRTQRQTITIHVISFSFGVTPLTSIMKNKLPTKNATEPLELPHPAGESPGRIQLLERQGRGLSELFDPIKSHATFLITQLGAHGNGGLALLITYGDNVTLLIWEKFWKKMRNWVIETAVLLQNLSWILH